MDDLICHREIPRQAHDAPIRAMPSRTVRQVRRREPVVKMFATVR